MTKVTQTQRIDAMENTLNSINETLALLAKGQQIAVDPTPCAITSCESDAGIDGYCEDCLHIFATISKAFEAAGTVKKTAKSSKTEVVPHDVTVDFDATIADLVPIVLSQLKAKAKANASMIPFGIGDETARPKGRIDYRVYLGTSDNRRFKADRKAAGIPMTDACLSLADAVDAARKVK